MSIKQRRLRLTDRFETFLHGIFSKKQMWSFIATLLLWKGLITDEIWMLFVGSMLGIHSFEKIRNVEPRKLPKDEESQGD